MRLLGRGLCLTSLAAVIIMTAVEGTWGTALHGTPVFWTAVFLMAVSLGMTVLDAARNNGAKSHSLSHIGLLLIIFGAFWESLEADDGRIAVGTEQAVDVAVSDEGFAVPLPFSIRLVSFETEFYEDGVSPRQYSSRLDIEGEEYVTSVNHPCLRRGWLIYQSDYDHENGAYSVLQVVRNPCLPLIFLGVFLLALGAILGFRRDWNSKWTAVIILALAVVFGIISVARINFGTLMPALRSLWFVPHLALYMLAYSALAISLICGVFAAFGIGRERLRCLSSRLFSTASSALLLGMLCGAVWAQICWGSWWTWDAKECWAAVTWMLTLVGMHLPGRLRRKGWALLVCIALSFGAMQVAWYGVERLPASQYSLHTYK